jgi:hypothetical protein
MNDRNNPLMANAKPGTVPERRTPKKDDADKVKANISQELEQKAVEEVMNSFIEDAVKEGENDPNRPLTPEEKEKRYMDGLAYVGITKEEAVYVMDQVLFEGFYEEEYKIANRVKVTFSTRNYRDVQRATRLIEAENPMQPMHINDLIARFNLASSIRRFGERVFSIPDPTSSIEDLDKSFYERLDFVMSKPAMVVEYMVRELAAFDMKIRAVFAEGAPENF